METNKKRLAVIVFLCCLFVTGALLPRLTRKKTNAPNAPLTPMILSSPSFQNNGYLPAKFTCDGVGVNPPLRFADIPDGAISLALILDDPDSPSKQFTHWLIWNIDPKTTAIEENSFPREAIQGRTNFRENKYGGPCPPTGAHHYRFRLYALDAMLDLPLSTDKPSLLAALAGHTLAEAELIGLYAR